MHGYRTVAGPGKSELVLKKSRFIGRAVPVANEDEALTFIAALKKQHWDASHNCYAYIIDPHCMRSGDDGEPGGTAGRPMLEVLNKESLEQTAVVVTRYFGGVLLGTGGLIRAYAQTAKAAIEAAGLGRQVLYRRLVLTLDYSLYGKVESALAEEKTTLLNSAFTDTVRVEAGLPSENIQRVSALLKDLTHGQIGLALGEEYHQFVRGI